MPYSSVNNPKHWRECAEDARTMADGVVDPGARKTMAAVADTYDAMARNAEQHAMRQLPAKNF